MDKTGGGGGRGPGGAGGGGGGNRVPVGLEGSALLDRQSTDHAGTAPSKRHWPHQPPPAFDMKNKDFKLRHCRGNSLGALNKVGLFPSFLIRLKKKKPRSTLVPDAEEQGKVAPASRSQANTPHPAPPPQPGRGSRPSSPLIKSLCTKK